jgi:pimeloyl-ACP methyl ester carboxylesterase
VKTAEVNGYPLAYTEKGSGPTVVLVISEMARARPDLVAKLVLAEAATDALLPAPSAEQLANRKKFAEHTEGVLKSKGPDAALEFAVDTLNGKGAWSRYPAVVQAIHRDNAWTVIGTARDTSARGTCADFGSLKMPVLLVTGQNTSPRYKRILEEQARCLPSSKTAVIPNVGHAMMMNPQVFNPTLKEFLK